MSEIQSASARAAQKKVKPRTPKVNELIAKCRSVILGTVDAGGAPNASYAPVVRIGNELYILVSFMSRHTANLVETKRASVMFIEDEVNAKQIYARERLTIDAVASRVDRGTSEWDLGIEKLKESHGGVLDILAGLEDFIMIRLTPKKASYVNGFGSAYYVNENLEIIEHRNDVGHTVASENA